MTPFALKMTFTVIMLLGMGASLSIVDRPRKPLTAGVWIFSTLVEVWLLVMMWKVFK